MAQDVKVKTTCDAPGCRRELGQAHDHVRVTLSHTVAENDNPGESRMAPLTGGQVLDFCSLEHAAEWLRSEAKPAAQRRAELIEAYTPAPAEGESAEG